MSETVKLIIEIPKARYEDLKNFVPAETDEEEYIKNGMPLEEVKTKIDTNLSWDMFDEYGNETRLHKELMEILDSVGKGDKE